jgi:hypothetical protein
MGSYAYPCPFCGQQQRLEIPNGTRVGRHKLCAACQEKADANPGGLEAHADAARARLDAEGEGPNVRAV